MNAPEIDLDEIKRQETAAAQLMSRARTQLIIRQPFFGSLAMRLKFGPTWTHPTAATDGRRLIYNPEFINAQSLPAVMGIIAHEIMHCALEHQKRRGTRDPKRWNIAGDIVINPLITGDGSGLELTQGCLWPEPDEVGLSTEEVYNRIKTPPEPKEPKPGQDPGQGAGNSPGDGPRSPQESPQEDDPEEDAQEDEPEPQDEPQEDEPNGTRREIDPKDYADLGEVLDDPGPDPDDPSADNESWTSAAIAARDFAKGRGNMPMKIDAAITDSIRPTYTLNDIVRQFITNATKADYSWRRPNRNYIAQGLRAPSLDLPEPGRIAVFIDISGSISNEQVHAALDAVSGVMEEIRAPLRIICCNTMITFDKRFEPGDVIGIPDGSGGGTDFAPPFERIAQDPEPPACIIYLSADMDGSMPEPNQEPPCPVLWISEPLTETPPIPFGQWYGVKTPQERSR